MVVDVPQVFIPISANQPFNATRRVEIGTDMLLQPEELHPGSVKEAIHKVLNEPRYRAAA